MAKKISDAIAKQLKKLGIKNVTTEDDAREKLLAILEKNGIEGMEDEDTESLIDMAESFIEDDDEDTDDAESEETDSDDMGKNQHGSGNKSSDHMEKIPQGSGFNVGDKYNNDKYNNRLSDTDLSNPKEEKTLTNVNAKVKTSLSERKQMPKSAKQRYLDMKSNEIDMLNRAYNICYENYDEPIADEIYNTIEHYFEKYTEKTDKIHPILTDNTLRDIIERMANFSDTEYEHFERVIETQGQFIKAVDAFFDTDFGSRTGYQTNWNLPHFMSDGVLDRLMQRIAEY